MASAGPKTDWKILVAEENPEAVSYDGFDTCILGIVRRFGMGAVLAYDYDQCIKVLMTRDRMNLEDAREFFEFNVAGTWAGEGTPAFVSLTP